MPYSPEETARDFELLVSNGYIDEKNIQKGGFGRLVKRNRNVVNFPFYHMNGRVEFYWNDSQVFARGEVNFGDTTEKIPETRIPSRDTSELIKLFAIVINTGKRLLDIETPF